MPLPAAVSVKRTGNHALKGRLRPDVLSQKSSAPWSDPHSFKGLPEPTAIIRTKLVPGRCSDAAQMPARRLMQRNATHIQPELHAVGTQFSLCGNMIRGFLPAIRWEHFRRINARQLESLPPFGHRCSGNREASGASEGDVLQSDGRESGKLAVHRCSDQNFLLRRSAADLIYP